MWPLRDATDRQLTNFTIQAERWLLRWVGWSEARFSFKHNRLRCVNENRKKRKRLRVDKQPIVVATASTEHSYWLTLAFVAWTQAIAFEWKPGLRHQPTSLMMKHPVWVRLPWEVTTSAVDVSRRDQRWWHTVTGSNVEAVITVLRRPPIWFQHTPEQTVITFLSAAKFQLLRISHKTKVQRSKRHENRRAIERDFRADAVSPLGVSAHSRPAAGAADGGPGLARTAAQCGTGM